MDLQSLGFEGGAMAAQVGFLFWIYKALTNRVDKLEAHVDKRLNNGIQTKLHDIEMRQSDLACEIARIDGRCTNCPSKTKAE